jgi:hypothetical protein
LIGEDAFYVSYQKRKLDCLIFLVYFCII